MNSIKLVNKALGLDMVFQVCSWGPFVVKRMGKEKTVDSKEPTIERSKMKFIVLQQ